jgi:hypothetical protein
MVWFVRVIYQGILKLRNVALDGVVLRYLHRFTLAVEFVFGPAVAASIV